MARAETIESVGDAGIGTHGLFSQHNTCCMELTRPLQSWPGLLSTATITISSGSASTPAHRHHTDHGLQPLQAICVSYPSSYLHPEGPAQPQPHYQLPTLSSAPHPLPLQNQGEEFDEGFPGQQPGKILIFSYEYSREITGNNGKNTTMLHACMFFSGVSGRFKRAVNVALIVISLIIDGSSLLRWIENSACWK